MSKFGEDTVRRVADLARLQLSDAEVTRFTQQVGDILSYVEKLNALDTSAVEPMTTPHEIATPLRADEVKPNPGVEVMTGCAPESVHDHYKVPQVLGGG